MQANYALQSLNNLATYQEHNQILPTTNIGITIKFCSPEVLRNILKILEFFLSIIISFSYLHDLASSASIKNCVWDDLVIL